MKDAHAAFKALDEVDEMRPLSLDERQVLENAAHQLLYTLCSVQCEVSKAIDEVGIMIGETSLDYMRGLPEKIAALKARRAASAGAGDIGHPTLAV